MTHQGDNEDVCNREVERRIHLSYTDHMILLLRLSELVYRVCVGLVIQE